MPRATLSFPILFLLLAAQAGAQRDVAGAAAMEQALARLSTVGSVLMIAAHPDDENTALLACFARGRHLRTGYLSLTRGEGGQNLIGPEQGDLLGVIRTQELLAARRIDGGQQMFSRAIDFGFSKSPGEAMSKWGREEILGDVVRAIRAFRPDVIVLRFTGTPRDGHGQHQASAMLGREAFAAAADPARFPEQLRTLRPWQAKRLMHNVFQFTREMEQQAATVPDRVGVDAGEFDPVLGYSYAEIAGMSRSQHRSQAMGAGERRGAAKQYLITLAGDQARNDPFDGIDTTWNGIQDGRPVAEALDAARRKFDPAHPDGILDELIRARALAAASKDERAAGKVEEFGDAIALASGLWLEAAADRYAAVPGSKVTVRATAINRSSAAVRLEKVELMGAGISANGQALEYNEPLLSSLDWTVPADQPYSQPVWLRRPKQGDRYTIDDPALVNVAEGGPVLTARFDVVIQGQPLSITRPVIHRYVDPVRGELTRPFTVVPPAVARLAESALLFPTAAARPVSVEVRANAAKVAGTLRLELPKGWSAEPASAAFEIAESGQTRSFDFRVTPPAAESRAALRAVLEVGGRAIGASMNLIDYVHIPPQVVFEPAAASMVRADVRVSARTVGYVMGAADEVPGALRQLGLDVKLLSAADLASGGLAQFDAIVLGARACAVRPDVKANFTRLLDYVSGGGTLIVQYQRLEAGDSMNWIGPYPLRIGSQRVTDETAPVAFLDGVDGLLRRPNEIGARDFEGWIQERGLYFASEWDSRYQPLFELNDPGEKPLRGAVLYARHGKGVYLFTAFSWFRELPAGVPGAYRIFANFLSAARP